MIQFRDMQKKDVEEVVKIEEETFSMPWSQNAFLEMIEAEYAHYMVAEEDNKIIGSCGLRNIAGEGEITNVVIRPEYRNMGIGVNMLCKLIKNAEKIGIQAFTLEVRESNAPAIHVYEKLGFWAEGIRKNFYEKPCEDAVIMWKR